MVFVGECVSVRLRLTDVDLLQLVKPLSRQYAVTEGINGHLHSLLAIFVRERNSRLILGDVFGACRGGAVHLAFFTHAN